MCEKVNFNVIEKNKYENIDDITKYINKNIKEINDLNFYNKQR